MASPPSIIRSGLSNTSTYTLNTFSGYFGTGVTFDLVPFEGGKFFFQPTIGVSTNQQQFEQSKYYTNTKAWTSFYLVRAYFTKSLGDNSSLIIGTDFRGYLPAYTPQYAIYAGLNVDFNALTKILK